MLFSSADVVKQINGGFEPAWESVHEVPTVSINFGNGRTITRTLNGNIATYLCTSEGNVLDVIPGLYVPNAYLECLGQFQLLHRLVLSQFGAAAVERLTAYHKQLALALKEGRPPDVLVQTSDTGKSSVERTIKLMPVSKAAKAARDAALADSKQATSEFEEVALWNALVDDTKLNETIRREQIHRKIAEVGSVKPAQLVKWLYKDVLHVDLDDPYLGLGEMLFKNYPFAKEDAQR